MVGIAQRISRTVSVVVSTDKQAEAVRPLVGGATVYVDPEGSERCALTGALTAFEFSPSRYTLLLPVDTPLASPMLLEALVDLAEGHGAVVPRWPSGYIEPLHSVYLSEHAYSRGLEVYNKGGRRMSELLAVLNHVLYVSTSSLKVFDSALRTFDNVNTADDLRRLERETSRAS